MTKLSVNLNKVALLRNTRTVGVPDLFRAASVSLEAGAHGITVHPRPDERHIRSSDLLPLAKFIRENFPQAELNIEGNPFIEKKISRFEKIENINKTSLEIRSYLDLIVECRPAQFTLVPDTVEQSTSDHGWDISANKEELAKLIGKLKQAGIRVSLFMDTDVENILILEGLGADRIELYTENYARGYAKKGIDFDISPYLKAMKVATKLGLGVNAGHDLNAENLPHFIKALPEILEVSIGHALIADAVFIGLEESVKKYLACLSA